MLEKIIVVVLGVVCLVGIVVGWWMENGPTNKDKTSDEEGKQEKSEDKR